MVNYYDARPYEIGRHTLKGDPSNRDSITRLVRVVDRLSERVAKLEKRVNVKD